MTIGGGAWRAHECLEKLRKSHKGIRLSLEPECDGMCTLHKRRWSKGSLFTKEPHARMDSIVRLRAVICQAGGHVSGQHRLFDPGLSRSENAGGPYLS